MLTMHTHPLPSLPLCHPDLKVDLSAPQLKTGGENKETGYPSRPCHPSLSVLPAISLSLSSLPSFSFPFSPLSSFSLSSLFLLSTVCPPPLPPPSSLLEYCSYNVVHLSPLRLLCVWGCAHLFSAGCGASKEPSRSPLQDQRDGGEGLRGDWRRWEEVEGF